MELKMALELPHRSHRHARGLRRSAGSKASEVISSRFSVTCSPGDRGILSGDCIGVDGTWNRDVPAATRYTSRR